MNPMLTSFFIVAGVRPLQDIVNMGLTSSTTPPRSGI
jgi:hypothetical protein